MHAVAWRTLRSASPRSRSPAKIIKSRRYPRSRQRSFHTSSCLAQDSPASPNLPTSPSNLPNTSIEQNDQENNSRGKEGPREKSEDAGKPEEPEILAKKLQRSKDMVRHYGSALKRSQRHNRSQDLPPIHIPNWFLKENVWLREETPESIRNYRNTTVTLKDRDTENAVASLPLRVSESLLDYYSKLSSRLGRELKEDEVRQIRDIIAQTSTSVPVPERHPPEVSESSKFQSKEAARANDRMEMRFSFPVLAEVRATIAACLATARPESTNSFPAMKTNVILESPSNKVEWHLLGLVMQVAGELGADVVALDAQDIAELAGDYLGEGPEPSPHSIRSLGYDTYKLKSDLQRDVQEMEEQEEEDDEHDLPSGTQPSLGMSGRPTSGTGSPNMMAGAVRVFSLDSLTNSPLLKALGLPSNNGPSHNSQSSFSPGRVQSQNEVQWEDMKLVALLRALVDSNEEKRTRSITEPGIKDEEESQPASSTTLSANDQPALKFFDYSVPAKKVDIDYSDILPHGTSDKFELKVQLGEAPQSNRLSQKTKIIYIRDIKELNATRRGSQVLEKLQEIIRKRRADGEQIMILGTSYSADFMPELSKAGIRSEQTEDEGSYYRTIVVPLKPKPFSPLKVNKTDEGSIWWPTAPPERSDLDSEMMKNARINARHIRDMLRRLDPDVPINVPTSYSDIRGDSPLSLYRFLEHGLFISRVMSHDEVHRVALTTFGIYLSEPNTNGVTASHISLAMTLLHYSDEIKFEWATREVRRQKQDRFRDSKGLPGSKKDSIPHNDRMQKNLDRISSQANKYEKRLINGVVNPDKIKTTFSDVHAPKETVEALRTLTTLSLLRPEAFKYGVLATDKIPGLLLYGPPGTGKTLLAKAVAKESGATVLEISGSEVYDMYVGEGEKNVRAIFSLARKLSPCVVFIDEADAIFGSRDGGRQRTSHREIINQFLKEWDGMNDLSVFIMVATNRPFDMDDAVLRRLPRRLLVDLPTQEDRKRILDIHLKGEQLDPGVNVEEIAKSTPLYSGSDLKNLAVAAALACVREENEQAAIAAAKAISESSSSNTTSETSPESDTKPSPPPMSSFLPEKRTLRKHHFDKAMQEISASISEDMSSLNAIKKFDEQFGDRKGRRKKNAYGFGLQVEKDEGVARVRK